MYVGHFRLFFFLSFLQLYRLLLDYILLECEIF